MEQEKHYEKVLKGEELSFDDRLEIISGLVSDKIFKTIMDNAVLAKATGEKISFKVSRNGNGSDEIDIGRILQIIRVKSYEVESTEHSCRDMGGGTDNYVNTKISLTF